MHPQLFPPMLNAYLILPPKSLDVPCVDRSVVTSSCVSSNYFFQCNGEAANYECPAYPGPEEVTWFQGRDAGDYRYTDDLLALEACRAGYTVQLADQALKITTPMHAERWEEALRQHPDTAFSGFICRGIRQGFRLGFDRSKCTPVCATRNMLSAS